MIKIGLSPSGSLHLTVDADNEPDLWTKKLTLAFSDNSCEGMFFLVAKKPPEQLDRTLSFWRDFASLYMVQLCHIPEPNNSKLEPIPSPPDSELQEVLLLAPPMLGAEYLSIQILNSLWEQFDQYVRAHVAKSSGIEDFIKKNAEHWHRVGRVCFHLAENKRNPHFPFAFLATYSSSVNSGGTLKHLPLGKALQEYSGSKNKAALIKLLSPINLASKKSKLANELIESSDIFHPLAWNSSQAYRFLRDSSLFEDCGIMVRLPDWWKRRAKPQVSVTIGNSKSAKLGVGEMLDFKMELVYDGQKLTTQEYEQLMLADNGLALLRGQWVEVDKEKLTEAIEHWKKIDSASNGGISFIDGMRLLAGAPTTITDSDIEQQEWSFVQADKWLSETLTQLKNPDKIAQSKPGKSLKAQLRPYQETGLNWLWFMSNLGLGACLADDMGLGKTIQILAMLLCLQKENEKQTKKPSLLILPASLVANWKSEAERFAPDLRLKFIHPSQISKQDIKEIANDPTQLLEFDLVITTYAMALRQKWLCNINWLTLIIDEAQAIKNPASGQTKAIKKLSADARIALTGTPIENRLGDLWSLMDFLNPGLLGSAGAFKGLIKQLESSENGYAPLRKLVTPYILRRLKTDKAIISDLPDKTEIRAYCGLSKQQLALYANSVKQLSKDLEIADGMHRKALVLGYLMRFKQICNHPSQLLGDGVYDAKHSGKFDRLEQICEEIASRQEKVLVFTQFKEMTEPLANFMSGIFGHNGLVLHGQTAVKKRKKLVDEFQNKNGPSFFILSLKAGGTGLNLTAASHVVHFDRWWNPAVENQATDRAFRIGQTKNVMVHKFVTQGTIEEKIDEIIQEKTRLADNILQGEANINLTEMSNNELIKLVSLDINKAGIYSN